VLGAIEGTVKNFNVWALDNVPYCRTRASPGFGRAPGGARQESRLSPQYMEVLWAERRAKAAKRRIVRQPGGLFFRLFLLAAQKKETRPLGRNQ